MKRSRLLFVAPVLVGLFLAGCDEIRPEDRSCGPDAWKYPKPRHAGFASGYFPPAFSKETLDCKDGRKLLPIISEVERDWYPEQFEAACEPSFYASSQEGGQAPFALRFSLIPTFAPSAFISVQKEGANYKLIARELSGLGGYDAGYLARSKEKVLSAKQVSDLMQMLEKGALFKEPAATCEEGFDGDEWLFEMVDKDGYRFVKRWSPDSGAAHDLGDLLIKLSGWKFDAY